MILAGVIYYTLTLFTYHTIIILALVPSGVVRYCLHSYHVGYTLKHRPMLFYIPFPV